MFESTKKDLKDLLRDADKGRLQLPDFQRDYVWGDDDVRSLIASIAKGFPVGALLTLQTGGEVTFSPRLIEGVPEKEVKPDDLLLDGQQRITSLYQSLFTRAPVRTKTVKEMHVDRFYYIDMVKAVSGRANIGEAIIGVPADRIVRGDFGKSILIDLSSPEKEFEQNVFPLNLVFDSKNWFYGWRDYWRDRGENVSELDKSFDQIIVDRIERYEMPIIQLNRKNSREAICLVFEKVNVGGKKLDAFELVTALYASEGFDLRSDWSGSKDKRVPGRHGRMLHGANRRDVLKGIASTDFLQACTLLHTREQRLAKVAQGVEGKELPQVTCQRDALLALPLTAYRTHADVVERGFIEAAGFMNEHKIIWHRDVPYPPQIVALASVFAILGRTALNAAAKDNLARWFWTIALGERYGSSTESKLAQDVPELVDWLSGKGAQPRSLNETLFQRDRLKTLRFRLSAAYKALHALLMRRGCVDFITGRPTDIMTFFDDKIDIHHIFPQAWCKKQGIMPGVFNSIINKTPLSKASNIAIGGDAPSRYLRRIEERHKISPERMDDILRTHLIDPALLRADDFEGLFAYRMKALSDLVADAMGKPVVEDHGADEAEIDVTAVEEDPDDEVEAA